MEKTVKPIRPQDIKLEKKIPWYIVEAVNELIQKYYNPSGDSFTITQEEILEVAYAKSDCKRDDCSYESFKSNIFKRHELDFEDLYREAGWSVTYDKPAYCENYKAYFEFKRND